MGQVTEWIWVLALAALWAVVPRFFSFNWLVDEDSIEEQPSLRMRCRNYLKEFFAGIFMGIVLVFRWRLIHDAALIVLMIVLAAVMVSVVRWRHSLRGAARNTK